MDLRPYQRKMNTEIHSAWGAGHRNVLSVMPTGAGKCLGKSTPMLMYDGDIKLVENIKTGDLIMGPDSEHRTVLSTCTGKEMMYKVTPVKGDSYIVNKSHILSLKKTGTYEIKNISVVDYLKTSKWFKHIHKGWRSGVDFNSPQVEHKIPPYILGIWLGDGCHSYNLTTLTSPDIEVVKEWKSFATSIGYKVSECEYRTDKCPMYRITHGVPKLENIFLTNLRNMGYGNASDLHIPQCYKTSSVEDRIEILSGIIDSDGHLSNGMYDLIFKQKRLAHDIAFIARSLGLAAYVKLSQKKCQGWVDKKEYFRVSITGDINILRCRIPRKQGNIRKQIKSVLVTGINVKPIGIGDYYGFEIDGDHLFMLGDFTVTHNTVCFTGVLAEHQGHSCAIAHRQELVGQMSMTLAKRQIKHNIIAPKNVVKNICRMQVEEYGTCYFTPNSKCFVAGVNTLVRRADALRNMCHQTTLWIIDEAQHLLKKNIWGKAVDLFPNARGLGVTATPLRADGNGLGRHHDGVMDYMIEGPSMRELIDQGFLTDYRIFAPETTIDLSSVNITASGDFNHKQLTAQTRKSQIVGDIVEHYIKIAYGKLGITFVTDVETAGDVAEQYNRYGIPAVALSAKTPDRERANAIRKFRNRELLQLVNIDLFSEGFDLPSIECVSMARPTESYGWFVQAFGRGLRPMEGKSHAIIIDHVGNTLRHGLPDAPRIWTLDRRPRRAKGAKDDVMAVKCCKKCTGVYEAFYSRCPYCGYVPVPKGRERPEQVDGNLLELTPEVLAAMRGDIDKIDKPDTVIRDNMLRSGASGIVANSVAKNHRERQEAQTDLRDTMRLWGAERRTAGWPDAESYRYFYLKFGTDVLTAQTLGRKDAKLLMDRIARDVI